MPWTIDLQPPREPELLSFFLLALGKALALANNFEAKCTHYLKVIVITEASKAGKTIAEIDLIAKNFHSEMIARTLQKILASGDITQQIYETLNLARESRNFVAHRGGYLGELHRANATMLIDAITTLRQHVENIAHGDNITSVWAYEVSEREPAPSSMIKNYVPMVLDWVFNPQVFEQRAK